MRSLELEPRRSIAPDLTHLASRSELAAGVLSNTPENLRLWLKNPAAYKPGAKCQTLNSRTNNWMIWWHIWRR